MSETYAPTSAELVFPPQAASSWTRRWARAHRLEGAKATPRTYRIAGLARGAEQLSDAIAFARQHDARLELD